MPIIAALGSLFAAFTWRAVIMSTVTLIVQVGAWSAVEYLLTKVAEWIKSEEQLSDDDAWLILGIELSAAIAAIGATAASLKSRLPVRIADKLGFNLATKKTLSQKGKTVAAQTTTAVVGAKRGRILKLMASAFAVSFAGSIPWLPSLFQNVMDQATFNPKNANAFLQQLGVPYQFPEPDPLAKPTFFSNAEWKQYVVGLQAAGVVGINDEFARQSLPFNEKNAAALLLRLSGQMALQGKSLTKATAKTAILPYLIKNNLTNETAVQQAALGTGTTNNAATSEAQSVVQQVQIAAREVLPFEPKNNDIIESEQELIQSAQNNLSAFVGSLPSRLIYDIRIVTSVTTKDGDVRYGRAVTVPTYIDKYGNQKTKTIRNKFAVLDVYVKNEKGARVKMQTITLGPTDASVYDPKREDISDLEERLNAQQSIQLSVRQENMAQLTIETTPQNPLGDAEQGGDVPSITQTPVIERDYLINGDGFYNAVRYRVGAKVYETYFVEDMLTDEEIIKLGNYGKAIEEVKRRLLQMGIDVEKFKRDTFYWEYNGAAAEMVRFPWKQFFFERLPGESAVTPSPIATAAGSGATTLSAWYAANGKPLPSIAERGALYESLGLGSKALYTGTAEQNTKLLAALKTQ